MSYNIPLDIQAEIIKSLPVKSLIRVRLVSKQWKSLIESSKFIAEYQKHNRHHHLLVRLRRFFYSDVEYVSIVDDDTFPQHKVSLTVPMSVYLLPNPNIVISSQGLVFLHGYDEYIGTTKALIWNPTIRKSVDIDVCCALKPRHLTFGFGVCPDTWEPKIVKFTLNQYSNNRDTIFEVFTLSTNAWRRLSKNLPRERIYLTANQVAIDRFMYWIAYEKIYPDVGNQLWYKRNLIVSFDMTSEEFTELNLPGSLDVDPASNFNLYNIGESLVVVHFKKEAGKRVHSVWKMMEHGASKSFTKLYTISTTDGINHVHGFRKSGEPIVESKNNHQEDFFAYELDSKHLHYIGIIGNPYLFRCGAKNTRLFGAGEYDIESGVAIDRFMYWFAWEARYVGDRLRYKRNLIMSFDMKSEEFTEIKLPKSLEADPATDFNLYNIRESLVMVQYKEAYVYIVWKMTEHGVSKSFTKLYTINPTDDVILDMYGFRTSGEPVVKTENNPQRDLFAYDPDSKHMNYIGIPGSTRDFYPTVYSYTETLLLLDH
nr:hypothetical protein [Tanacetum cinerariifolium]